MTLNDESSHGFSSWTFQRRTALYDAVSEVDVDRLLDLAQSAVVSRTQLLCSRLREGHVLHGTRTLLVLSDFPCGSLLVFGHLYLQERRVRLQIKLVVGDL